MSVIETGRDGVRNRVSDKGGRIKDKKPWRLF